MGVEMKMHCLINKLVISAVLLFVGANVFGQSNVGCIKVKSHGGEWAYHSIKGQSMQLVTQERTPYSFTITKHEHTIACVDYSSLKDKETVSYTFNFALLGDDMAECTFTVVATSTGLSQTVGAQATGATHKHYNPIECTNHVKDADNVHLRVKAHGQDDDTESRGMQAL